MAWIESTLPSQSDPVPYWCWDLDPPNAQQLDYLQRSLLLVPPEHAEIIYDNLGQTSLNSIVM